MYYTLYLDLWKDSFWVVEKKVFVVTQEGSIVDDIYM